MFQSLLHQVIIPQSEHLKLAGALALLWGNAQFERPPLPADSVLAGIALHDRTYGYVDNIAIGTVDAETWLKLTRQGFYMPCRDPLADIITRHHLWRLTRGSQGAAYQTLAQEMEAVLAQQMAEQGLAAELFQQMDTITRLCDHVSFDFCFGDTPASSLEVCSSFTRGEKQRIHFTLTARQITLDPWPLSVTSYQGYLVGYHVEGYPERLDGVVLPYSIQPVDTSVY